MRNAGIRESKGAWIVFVDVDDWIELDIFSELAGHCNDVDIIVLSATVKVLADMYHSSMVNDLLIYSEGIDVLSSLTELNDKFLKQCLKTSNQRYDTVEYYLGKVFRRKFFIRG